VAKFHAAGN